MKVNKIYIQTEPNKNKRGPKGTKKTFQITTKSVSARSYSVSTGRSRTV